MTALAPAEPQPWPRRRWWGLVALVFGAQLGLILWLSDRTPLRPRRASAQPSLQIAPAKGSAELLALTDPTLFALPHREGFAWLAWLEVPPFKPQSFTWSEPPRWLAPSLTDLGLAFSRFIQTNRFAAPSPPVGPQPELVMPGPAPLPLAREQSELRLKGALAQRRLISPPELPSWPSSDLLTNTVVQLAVDAAGRPVSFTLLPPGSGSKDADQYALDQARAARFEPLSGGTPAGTSPQTTALTWGMMIFQWHTLPVPPTNAPPAGP